MRETNANLAKLRYVQPEFCEKCNKTSKNRNIDQILRKLIKKIG